MVDSPSYFWRNLRGTVARARSAVARGAKALVAAKSLLLMFWGVAAASGTTIAPPEFGRLVNGADYIVHGITRSVTAEKRADARGMKIVTHVEVEVVEVVAGVPPQKIVLEMLGGRVGNEELRVEGAPRFRVGDEDILFVSGNGRTICPLYGMSYGRYPIKTDPASGRKYVARGDGRPLRDTAEISAPLPEGSTAGNPGARSTVGAALGPAEFIRQIKASRGAGAQGNREK